MFILQVIVCENVNLPHIYDMDGKKIIYDMKIIKHFKWFINLV